MQEAKITNYPTIDISVFKEIRQTLSSIHEYYGDDAKFKSSVNDLVARIPDLVRRITWEIQDNVITVNDERIRIYSNSLTAELHISLNNFLNYISNKYEFENLRDLIRIANELFKHPKKGFSYPEYSMLAMKAIVEILSAVELYLAEYNLLAGEFNIEEDLKRNKEQWTALTYILAKYFENQCQPLNDSQVESINPTGITKASLKNKHRKMSYELASGENHLTVNAYRKAYEQLQNHFSNNITALAAVQKAYARLNKEYSAK